MKRQYRNKPSFDVAPYIEMERRIAEATVRDAIARKRSLAADTYPGYLYIVEFGSGVIKVGKTTNPRYRITSHATMAAVHNDRVLRHWLSARHAGFSANEHRLIEFCKQHGRSAGRHEYFREISFETAKDFVVAALGNDPS